MDLLNRVSDAWRALLARPSCAVLAMAEEIASLRGQVAELRLDVQEARATIDVQRSRLVQMESAAAQHMGDPLESILADLAPFLSQLRMQAALMESGNQISAKSVMALAKQLMSRLEQAGLDPIGSTGQVATFDPVLHQPLSSAASFASGDAVVVRFIGYRYKDRIVRKAMVEAQ